MFSHRPERSAHAQTALFVQASPRSAQVRARARVRRRSRLQARRAQGGSVAARASRFAACYERTCGAQRVRTAAVRVQVRGAARRRVAARA